MRFAEFVDKPVDAAIDAESPPRTRASGRRAASHGRLNLFQRMMLRWRTLHPYNPVHVVRIPSALDLSRLRAVIAAQLASRGLSNLRVDPGGRQLRFDTEPSELQFEQVPGEHVSTAELAAVIERELNRPFAASGRFNPLRFCVAQSGASFQLVLVYDHFVASGDSVASLLTDVALAYLGAAGPLAPKARSDKNGTYRNLFVRHPMWALRAVLTLPAMALRMRRASRPVGVGAPDADNGFFLVRVEPAQLHALIAASKRWGVTVNDLLLAGLLLALAPRTASRHLHAHRKELAVASIVNIRDDFRTDADLAPSPCLAAFHVSHAVPDGIGLCELACNVHASTAPIRRQRLYLRSILALGLSGLLWPVLRQRQRRNLYAKYFPAWGGVTSLNLNPIWAAKGAPATRQLDYFRVVPTGPLCPLVLAATTAHDVMHVGISYRKSVFAAPSVAQVAQDFLRSIDMSGQAR